MFAEASKPSKSFLGCSSRESPRTVIAAQRSTTLRATQPCNRRQPRLPGVRHGRGGGLGHSVSPFFPLDDSRVLAKLFPPDRNFVILG